jgi:hypothetical protein
MHQLHPHLCSHSKYSHANIHTEQELHTLAEGAYGSRQARPCVHLSALFSSNAPQYPLPACYSSSRILFNQEGGRLTRLQTNNLISLFVVLTLAHMNCALGFRGAGQVLRLAGSQAWGTPTWTHCCMTGGQCTQPLPNRPSPRHKSRQQPVAAPHAERCRQRLCFASPSCPYCSLLAKSSSVVPRAPRHPC